MNVESNNNGQRRSISPTSSQRMKEKPSYPASNGEIDCDDQEEPKTKRFSKPMRTQRAKDSSTVLIPLSGNAEALNLLMLAQGVRSRTLALRKQIFDGELNPKTLGRVTQAFGIFRETCDDIGGCLASVHLSRITIRKETSKTKTSEKEVLDKKS